MNLKTFARELDNYPILADLESYTRVPKLVLVASVGPVLLIAHFLLGMPAQTLCDMVGVTYPAIASLRALETRDKSDDTQWLTYWTVYATFVVLESLLLRPLLAAFPFYYAFKLGLLVWAQAPSTKGAVFLYSRVFAPFLKNHAVAPPSQRAVGGSWNGGGGSASSSPKTSSLASSSGRASPAIGGGDHAGTAGNAATSSTS